MRHATAIALLSLALAMQIAGSPVITQHLIRRQQEQKDDSGDTPKSADTRSRNDKNDKSTSKQSSASATSSAAAQPSATVDTNSKGKVNVTLASMQYSQSLCTNTSQVLSGSWLNVTWIGKGKFSSTLYAKYGTDGFNAWTPGMSTAANTEGRRLDSNKKKDNLAVDWQMSYQHQVFQHNKAIIFTIVMRDEALNTTMAMYDSKPISIVGNCQRRGETKKEEKEKDDSDNEEAAESEPSEAAAANASALAAETNSDSQQGETSAEESAASSALASSSTGSLFVVWIASAILVIGL